MSTTIRHTTSFETTTLAQIARSAISGATAVGNGQIGIEFCTSGCGPQDQIDNDILFDVARAARESNKRSIPFNIKGIIVGTEASQIAMQAIASAAFYREKGEGGDIKSAIRAAGIAAVDEKIAVIRAAAKLQHAYGAGEIKGIIDIRVAQLSPFVGADTVAITEERTERDFTTAWFRSTHNYGIPNYLAAASRIEGVEAIQARIAFDNVWEHSSPIDHRSIPNAPELRAQIAREIAKF